MITIRVAVAGHWINAWFMRLFARPYVVVDGRRRRARWGKPVTFDVPETDVELGAGIRYFDRGPLLGYEPRAVRVGELSADSSGVLVFRNGLLNHQPFRLSGA